MKIHRVGLVAAALAIIFVSPAFSNGLPQRSGTSRPTFVHDRGRATVDYYRAQCRVICKGRTPAAAMLEDGLAYLVDIPLALVSPLTCPVVAPLLERFDSGSDRSFSRRTGR